MENLEPNTSHEHDGAYWRETFIDYYRTNAPTKVTMVNDAMMSKWDGKYDVLMSNLIKKYGVLGSPIEQPVRRPARTRTRPSPDFGKKKSERVTHTIADLSSTFKALIAKATPTLPSRDVDAVSVVESKASDTENGLETSTFTVCTRVRPLLGHELTEGTAVGGEAFAAVVPGKRTPELNSHTEELLLHVPKISIMGAAKLQSTSYKFDYTFGPESTNQEIYDLACKPLVKRALNGQIGVIFAYGQTGSGKTHTMGGILDILSTSDIFTDLTDVTFSYIEMLGRKISDCLPATATTTTATTTTTEYGDVNDNDNDGARDDESGTSSKDVQIGEGLDGAVLIRNMSMHNVKDASQLAVLIQRANSIRATATTAKNDSSSRSHGVAILKVKNKKTDVEGTLYVIDLAGSESAKDSKSHDKDRMNETKEINSSLMVLKECIRARTSAARPGHGAMHVPFRRNKLTLLMKDVFDIGCSRMCSTVVIAACSPLASDIDHTSGTVKYAAPLRVAIAAGPNKQKDLEVDIHDPALWNNDKIVSWVEKTIDSSSFAAGKIFDASLFVNAMTGVQLCALPENEFYVRATAQLGDDDDDKESIMKEVAKSLYLGMWTLIVDAKTRKRTADGSIVTPEMEEKDRKQAAIALIERKKVWEEREKHLRA